MVPTHGGTCERTLEGRPLSWTRKLAGLNGAIEKLEGPVKKCTSRNDATARQLILNDDIRMASLEALLPSDLERRVKMDGSRLTKYFLLRQEVVLH